MGGSRGAREYDDSMQYCKRLLDMGGQLSRFFSTRFKDFQQISNDLTLVCRPFAFNVDNAPASIQLELCRSYTILPEQNNSGQSIII